MIEKTTAGPYKKPQIGADLNPRWKGGIIFEKSTGRFMVLCPGHPNPSKGRYVYRYRLVMEKHLGRHLEIEEVVHHINHNQSDDRIENLQLMTRVEHNRLTANHLKELGKWSIKHACCIECGTTDRKHKGHGRCYVCHEKIRTPRRKKVAS